MRLRADGAALPLALLMILALAFDAEAEPRFYQHQTYSQHERAAERVMQKGFSVRGYEPFSLSPPVDWAADPHQDSNWQYQLNAMYPLGPIFQGLAETDRPSWRRFARTVFLDWIQFNLVEDRPNPFKWNDMATGVRASYLAQLIAHEKAAGDIPVAEVELLVEAGRDHLSELSDPKKFADYNHGLFQLVGITALCEVENYLACDTAMPYARRRYGHLFSRQFNQEGMHLEHSPEYHLLGLNTFARIEQSGLLLLSSRQREHLDRAEANLSWWVHPDGGFAELGDTEAHSASGAARFDPGTLWLRSRGRRGIPPELGVRLFPLAGYAFARLGEGGSTYLALTVAHHSAIHKHADTFSFEWSDRGRRIVVDSGKWGYDPGPERDYVTSHRAHNVVELEGVDFQLRHPPARPPTLDAIEMRGMAVLTGTGSQASGRFYDPRHSRILVVSPGKWLIVRDEVWSLWPRPAVQWFQLPPRAELRQIDDGFAVRFPGVDEELSIFSLEAVDGTLARRGEKGAAWNGWYSPRYGQLEPSWQIGFRSNGFRHSYATVFRWVEARDEWPNIAAADVENGALCWTEGRNVLGVRVGDQLSKTGVTVCE